LPYPTYLEGATSSGRQPARPSVHARLPDNAHKADNRSALVTRQSLRGMSRSSCNMPHTSCRLQAGPALIALAQVAYPRRQP
jgi:hypothetical protein